MSNCYSCKRDGKCKDCWYRVYGKELIFRPKENSGNIDYDIAVKNQDNLVEKLWRECEDIAYKEDENLELVLDQPWRGFPVREFTQDDWFRWVDNHHSKGVGWVFENISQYDEEED